MRFLYFRSILRHVGGLITVVFLLMLGACGTTAGSASSAQDAGLPPKQCGAVHAMRSALSPMDWNMAGSVESCFWQAFQECQPATLAFTQSEAEASTINTFTLASEQGTCKITDSVQHYSTLHMPQSPTVYTCAGVQKHSDGLHILSCGPLGTILIPTVGAKE